MLIDLIILRAAMVRRIPDRAFEARPRDFIALPPSDHTVDVAPSPAAPRSTNR